jgi:hypothetical protein
MPAGLAGKHSENRRGIAEIAEMGRVDVAETATGRIHHIGLTLT